MHRNAAARHPPHPRTPDPRSDLPRLPRNAQHAVGPAGRRCARRIDQGERGSTSSSWTAPSRSRTTASTARSPARPAIDILEGDGQGRGAIIAIGSCSSWGGMPRADPNPTGATPVHKVLAEPASRLPVMNIPGCPPNPYNFLSTVLYFVTFSKLPELDDGPGPKFAYGRLIHENCERRPHFDAGRFATEFGDEDHARASASTSSAARAPRPTTTARRSSSATSAPAPGRSAWAIPASAARSRASASITVCSARPACTWSPRRIPSSRRRKARGRAGARPSAALPSPRPPSAPWSARCNKSRRSWARTKEGKK